MTVAAQPMLGRRQLRLAVVDALAKWGLSVNGVQATQESPGDWSLPEERLPLITVRTADESKVPPGMGQPCFTTTCAVAVRAVVTNSTAEAAQDDIEGLWYLVENAVLTNFSVIGASQRVASVRSSLEIKADGSRHLAGIVGVFEIEYFEAFDPTAIPPVATPWPANPPAPVSLTQLNVTGDLVNVYDAAGTYANPPFPAAVQPAPRTSGPDGRTEGGLTFNLEGN